MQNINQQPENLVAFDGEKLTTDSRIIAKAFNKGPQNSASRIR